MHTNQIYRLADETKQLAKYNHGWQINITKLMWRHCLQTHLYVNPSYNLHVHVHVHIHVRISHPPGYLEHNPLDLDTMDLDFTFSNLCYILNYFSCPSNIWDSRVLPYVLDTLDTLNIDYNFFSNIYIFYNFFKYKF